jgi:hypothetical protein
MTRRDRGLEYFRKAEEVGNYEADSLSTILLSESGLAMHSPEVAIHVPN